MASDGELDALDALLSTNLTGSAVSVHHVELRDYCFKDVWLSVEQIAIPTFPLRNVYGNHVKILVATMRTFAQDSHNGMIAVKGSAKCSSTDSTMEDAIALQGDQTVVRDGLEMILSYECHRRSTCPPSTFGWRIVMRPPKVEGGRK